eukprot:1870073-Lingulodinium_polyedra.AAC.1
MRARPGLWVSPGKRLAPPNPKSKPIGRAFTCALRGVATAIARGQMAQGIDRAAGRFSPRSPIRRPPICVFEVT